MSIIPDSRFRIFETSGRIELRTTSPDPSVPGGGLLVAYAYAHPHGWTVVTRTPPASHDVLHRAQAMANLLRWAQGGDL